MKRSERGQNLVETALAIPILFLFLAGVVDIGRVFYTYMAVANAAREGARYASHFPYDSTGIVTQTEQEAVASGIAISSVDITCRERDDTAISCADAISGDTVLVTASFENYQPFMIGFALDGPLDLDATAEMIVFGTQE